MLEGLRLHVTASIGVATKLNVGDDAETLLQHADAAQYEAKQNGRDCIRVFDVRMREKISRRLDAQQELRDGIKCGEIVGWYQPEVEIVTGAMTGAEALARWNHPGRGILDAGACIATAEESGLAYELDDVVISAAVRERAKLATDRTVNENFRIWCNVGEDQIRRAEPARRLASLLERSNCDPRFIGIEVTE